MAATTRRSAACTTLIVLFLVATVMSCTVITRSAWVDYPSSVVCGVTIPVEQCDPSDPAANSACRDACHYGGCRSGRCVSLGEGSGGRGCHCKG